MQTPGRSNIAGLALAAALLAVPAPVAAGSPAAVDLGRAAPFAVLAGAGVGATGPSRVIGDVGAYPSPAISGRLEAGVNGTVHHGGTDAQTAQADLAVAYALVAGTAPTRAGDGIGLDGARLDAGTYALTGASVALGGRLVLDGADDRDATWVFQVPSDLVTSPGSTIDLVNGAQACNVFWQVGGAVTLGADSAFAGTVLAMAAVTIEPGATVDGRLLSMTGRVLLGGASVALPVCAAAAPAAPAPAVAALPAGADLVDTPLSSPTVAAGGNGPPSLLPIVAIAAVLIAALLGEPRRQPRPAAGPW